MRSTGLLFLGFPGFPGTLHQRGLLGKQTMEKATTHFSCFQKEQLDHPRCLELDGSWKAVRPGVPPWTQWKSQGEGTRMPILHAKPKGIRTCRFHDCVCVMLLVVASRVCAESLKHEKWIYHPIWPSIIPLIMQETLFDPLRDLDLRCCSLPRIEIPGIKRQGESWKRMFLEEMRRWSL